MEQASPSLGLDLPNYHRFKRAYKKAKVGDNESFDWRMVAQEASVAWEKLTGVEWWIVYHTFKANLLDENALVQYNKTWEGMSLSVVDKPPFVVGAPKSLSKVDVDTTTNEDGYIGYHPTTEETKVLAALGILKYTLHPWDLASEKCWKFVGGNQLVSWEKYLSLVYQALMKSTPTRYYKIFAEREGVRRRILRFLTNLFGDTLHLDPFLKLFKGGSNLPYVAGIGRGARARLWKCQVVEEMREDGYEPTMMADDVDKKVKPTEHVRGRVGWYKIAGGSWKLRGHGRCLRFAEWKTIMQTDTHLDALIVKCGKRWTELLKGLNIVTTRSGEDIRKDFFAHVLPNLSEFGASGKKVVRPLNLRDRYTMITICHSLKVASKAGIADAVMELIKNEVLYDRKKNMLKSMRFWMRAYTRICRNKLIDVGIVGLIEFLHINVDVYNRLFYGRFIVI